MLWIFWGHHGIRIRFEGTAAAATEASDTEEGSCCCSHPVLVEMLCCWWTLSLRCYLEDPHQALQACADVRPLSLLCYVMLCYAKLCYAMSCHVMSRYVMLYYVMLYGYLYSASHRTLFRGALSVTGRWKEKSSNYVGTQVIPPVSSHSIVQEACHSRVQGPQQQRPASGLEKYGNKVQEDHSDQQSGAR